MDSKSYHKYLVQSAAGGVGFYAFNSMYNDTTRVFMFGKSYPTWLVGAGLGLVSSVASELIHHSVLPHIHVSKKMENSASAVVNPASSAAAWWLGARLGNVNLANTETTQLLAMGAVTEFVGNYVQKIALGEDGDAF